MASKLNETQRVLLEHIDDGGGWVTGPAECDAKEVAAHVVETQQWLAEAGEKVDVSLKRVEEAVVMPGEAWMDVLEKAMGSRRDGVLNWVYKDVMTPSQMARLSILLRKYAQVCVTCSSPLASSRGRLVLCPGAQLSPACLRILPPDAYPVGFLPP